MRALPVLERCEQEARARLGYGSSHAANNPKSKIQNPKSGVLRRGVGIACGIKNIGYSFGFPEQATCGVELQGGDTIERAIVRIGAADVGQGSHLAMRQIAAEALGVVLDKVELVADDSSVAPNAGSA